MLEILLFLVVLLAATAYVTMKSSTSTVPPQPIQYYQCSEGTCSVSKEPTPYTTENACLANCTTGTWYGCTVVGSDANGHPVYSGQCGPVSSSIGAFATMADCQKMGQCGRPQYFQCSEGPPGTVGVGCVTATVGPYTGPTGYAKCKTDCITRYSCATPPTGLCASRVTTDSKGWPLNPTECVSKCAPPPKTYYTCDGSTDGICVPTTVATAFTDIVSCSQQCCGQGVTGSTTPKLCKNASGTVLTCCSGLQCQQCDADTGTCKTTCGNCFQCEEGVCQPKCNYRTGNQCNSTTGQCEPIQCSCGQLWKCTPPTPPCPDGSASNCCKCTDL